MSVRPWRGALALAALAAAAAAVPAPAAAQTFVPERAVDMTACAKRWYGTFCRSVSTDRLGSTFTSSQMNRRLFASTWATATHCTRYDATDGDCERSVSVSTDPTWHRVVWGRNGSFLAAYGIPGSPSDGPGRLRLPLGVDISERVGTDWHVAFVADAGNNRVVVLSLNSSTRAVRELGSITGTESGVALNYPSDVAWDASSTYTMTDDRLFIADTRNSRVLVYHVSIDPAAGTFYRTYLGAFGTAGAGASQLQEPMGIDVFSSGGGRYTDVYVSDTGNQRVSLWYYDSNGPTVPAYGVSAVAQSAPIAGAEPMGISLDHFGDVYVADRARGRVLKLAETSLATLHDYGAGGSWQAGQFSAPSDVNVIRAYSTDAYGGFVDAGLPHLQTTEEWTGSTGGQMHELNVEVRDFTAREVDIETVHDLSGSFTFTGAGEYQVFVKSEYNQVVRSYPREYAYNGGVRTFYWDGRNQSGTPVAAGRYKIEVQYESMYTGDAVRTYTYPFNWGFFASISAPGYVSSTGTYYLSATASRAASGWQWERQHTYSSGYASGYWTEATVQNPSVMIYQEYSDYGVDWRLTTVDFMRSRAYATATTWVAGHYSSGGCPRQPCIEEPMSRAPVDPLGTGPLPAAPLQGKTLVTPTATGLQPGARVERRGGHFGAGAWVGRSTARGPRVVQLYSPAGRHEAQGAWPNALSGEPEVVQESPAGGDGVSARAVFRRVSAAQGRESYAVRVTSRAVGATAEGGGFVALALDPDLGARAGDDLLGLDPETGLVWVVDPDSGAMGYVVTDPPRGAQFTVRQFSSARERHNPDPAGDSAAYAQLAAGESWLTGHPGDVRFVAVLAGVPVEREVVLGLVVLRAASLDELRRAAAEVPRTGMLQAAGAGPVRIDRFQLTQAPPDPSAPAGVRSISPMDVPGLSLSVAGGAQPAAPSLRQAVREHGITALAFAVPEGEAARIQVRVYDPRGRLVKRLVDETHDPGAYRVQWDGTDERGGRVAPGVYVAVMEAPGFRATSRLVVVP